MFTQLHRMQGTIVQYIHCVCKLCDLATICNYQNLPIKTSPTVYARTSLSLHVSAVSSATVGVKKLFP